MGREARNRFRTSAGAGLKLLKRPLRNQGAVPETMVTDDLKFEGPVPSILGIIDCRRTGRLREDNRELASSYPATRTEDARAQVPARSLAPPHHSRRDLQRIDYQRHLINRPTLRLFRARADCAWTLAAA